MKPYKARKTARQLFTICVLALCVAAHAETRWCPITGTGKSDTLFYPPIARVAHLQGVVIGRLHFTPSGVVTAWEPVSGPPIIRQSVGTQLQKWTLRTDAHGEAECQSLVIAAFQIVDDKRNLDDARATFAPVGMNILRMTVVAETFVIGDPASKICKRRWYRLFSRSCR